MRNNFRFFVTVIAMFSLLLFSSCENTGLDSTDGAEVPGLVEELPGLAVQFTEPYTKLSVADGTGRCTWMDPATSTMKDTIALWLDNDGTNTGVYSSLVVNKISAANGTIGSVSYTEESGKSRNNYAVYPASAAVASSPGAGDARPQVRYGTRYDLSSLSADSLRTYSRIPMIANNKKGVNSSLEFVHVGGLLRVRIVGAPAGTNAVSVTFLGMDNVTGVYEVRDATKGEHTSQSASTDVSSPVTGTGNSVSFVLPSGVSGAVDVNVPLPCGDYGSLNGIRIDVSGGTSQSRVMRAVWSEITHGQGKQLECDFSAPAGSLEYVELGARDAITMWKGQDTTRTAMAFDDNFNQVGAALVWSSSDQTVASVNSSTGVVTAVSAGEALITVTASLGGVQKTASYTVYVNEATITLKPSSLIGRVGKTGKIAAEVTYTRNGEWSVPVLAWSTSNVQVGGVDVVTLQHAETLSGESNIVEYGAKYSGSQAKVIASIKVGSATVASTTVEATVEVVSDAYIPGKFTVSETGKQVYFSKGNLYVDVSDPDPSNYIWKFEQNQWNFNQDMTNEKHISYFCWGTGNNPKATGPSSNPDSSTDFIAQCDWGRHFDDDGIGYAAVQTGKTWYTLSVEEWEHLLDGRSAGALLRGMAILYIESENKPVKGLIILPDNWECPETCSFSPTASAINLYTTGTDAMYDGLWSDMEASGAVFMPIGGFWTNRISFQNGHAGVYWSSSRYTSNGKGYSFLFQEGDYGYISNYSYYVASFVRLVHD